MKHEILLYVFILKDDIVQVWMYMMDVYDGLCNKRFCNLMQYFDVMCWGKYWLNMSFCWPFFTMLSPWAACFLWQQHKCSIEQKQKDILNQAYQWGRRYLMIPITVCSSTVCLNALWGNEPSLLFGKRQVGELRWGNTAHIPSLFWDYTLLLHKFPSMMN